MDNVAYVEPNISNLQPIYASQITGSFQTFQLGAGAKAIKMDRSGLFMGAELFADAPFSVDMSGNVWANSIWINGIDSTLLTDAIDEDGNFINQLISDTLNTQTKQILGEYTFSGVGALAIKTDASNGIWISPTGILAKNAGNTKFALDNAGNATFGGTLVAASGTFGTITSGTIRGCTIQSTSGAARVELSTGDVLNFYYDSVVRGYMKSESTTDLTISANDDVQFRAGGAKRCKVASGAFAPMSDRAYDLGTDANQWRGVYCERLYTGASGTGGFVGPATYGFITSVQLNGRTLQAKYREITFIGGAVTSITGESNWTNMDTLSCTAINECT